jgi:3-phosphoshikimate 1-carboxyvinyltransferase
LSVKVSHASALGAIRADHRGAARGADTLQRMGSIGPAGVPRDEGVWSTPYAAHPASGTARIPGSKSMTNRALVLAALSGGPTTICGPLVARDTELMAGALRALGWNIAEADGDWRAERSAEDDRHRTVDVDVGNAGTVLRFIPPAAALTTAEARFRGDARVSVRPIGPLLQALRDLGASVDDDGSGRVPFVVRGRGGIAGGSVTLDASSSSQLISGLLLAAPRFDRGAQIRHSGPPVPSAPHIEMTVRMLRDRGVDVTASPEYWQVVPGPIAPGQISIEPDVSNAVPFLAAAMVTGGELTIPGWPVTSLQPVRQVLELLTAMGARVELTKAGLRVSGPGEIRGIVADLSEVGELTPVLTALAALASSPSEFRGIGHLRRHESDRLAALAAEIGKLGGDVTELDDGLRIIPRRLRADGQVIDSHDDHRLVMAAAVLGLVTPGLRVSNAATVGKTFPGFSQSWTQVLAPAG